MDSFRNTTRKGRFGWTCAGAGLLGLALLVAGCVSDGAPPLPLEGKRGYVGREQDLPPIQREFRASWVATVENIDWPSKRGLPVEQQKSELIAILDKAASLRLNAIILQVRPACDAMYASKLEPWSEYLTGAQGQAPDPKYDPLAFAVAAAHARGLELHAWFNPFRVKTKGGGAASDGHISKKRPDLVRTYGDQLWLDPGEPDAQKHSLAVFVDVVKRYDVDGIHIDDYFYPYQVKDAQGKSVPFPDDASYAKYCGGGGKLDRDDWRRDNINRFVKAMYEETKRAKKHVLVGVSPFGIWRPGNPPTIKGMDAYTAIYADSKLWLEQGWCDYFTPQLYWPIDREGQRYPLLLKWWTEHNPHARHLWIGNSISGVGRSITADETLNQIRLTRELGAGGNVLFSFKGLMANRGGLSDKLLETAYSTPAIPAATTWLDDDPPPACDARAIEQKEGALRLAWRPPDFSERPFRWVLRMRDDGAWNTLVLPGSQYRLVVTGGRDGRPPEQVAISPVDRLENVGPPRVIDIEPALAAAGGAAR